MALQVEHAVQTRPVVLAHLGLAGLTRGLIGPFYVEDGLAPAGFVFTRAEHTAQEPDGAAVLRNVVRVLDHPPAPCLLVRERAEQHADVRRVRPLHLVHDGDVADRQTRRPPGPGVSGL